MKIVRWHWALLLICVAVLIWSGIDPRDRMTWVLEVFPAVVGIGILMALYQRFRFTSLVYVLVALHAIVLIVGGHYTYAHVPLGEWVADLFEIERNHYDRLGHFMQGFVPALIAREVLLRVTPLRRGGWLFGLVVAVALAISAFYEFIEWWVALLSEQAAESFLGTQGAVWDTQWDMFLAFCGAILAQLLLAHWQDKQMLE
ncbi:MAG TPA: DUF2238 domain-containing protein [Gammaproteobacteria bacterium]|nr:DUF2238 domain-containing protein [Gammaproteobacteria bacterium]